MKTLFVAALVALLVGCGTGGGGNVLAPAAPVNPVPAALPAAIAQEVALPPADLQPDAALLNCAWWNHGSCGVEISVLSQTAPSSSTLTTYTANGTRILPTLSGLDAFYEFAIDERGKIYIPNDLVPNGSLRTYASSGAPTTPVITGLFGPSGVAVDTGGKIYAIVGCSGCESRTGTILTYTAQGKPTTPTITLGICPCTLAVSSDRIYVAGGFGDNSLGGVGLEVKTYLMNGTEVSPTIYGPSGIGVYRLAVKADDSRIYIADYYLPNGKSTGAVLTYNSSGQLLTTYPINGAMGVAVDAHGKIYVASYSGSITSYTSAWIPTTPIINGLNSPFDVVVHNR